MTNLNYYKNGGVGSQADIYYLVLPMIGYSEITDNGITMENVIREMRNYPNVYAQTSIVKLDITECEYMRDMLLKTGFVSIDEENCYHINHIEYRNYLASRFWSLRFKNEMNNKDNLFEDIINRTRFYKKKGKYLNKDEKKQTLSYGEYVFESLLEELNQGSSEWDDESKKQLLLLGVNIGYELEFSFWKSIEQIVDWYITKYMKCSGEYNRTDCKIIVGVNSILYSILIVRPDDLEKYLKKNDSIFGVTEHDTIFDAKKKVIESVIDMQNAIVRALEMNEYLQETTRSIQPDFYGSLLGNIGASYQELAKFTWYYNRGNRNTVEKLLDKAIQFHKRGLNKKDEGNRIAIARGNIAIATDLYYKGLFDMKNNSVSCFHDAIDYHKEALRKIGYAWDEKQCILIYPNDYAMDTDIIFSDANPIIIMRRITGCYCKLWKEKKDNNASWNVYNAWIQTLKLLFDLCKDEKRLYNPWVVSDKFISKEIKGMIDDILRGELGDCLREVYLSESVTIDQNVKMLEDVYGIISNDRIDIGSYLKKQ